MSMPYDPYLRKSYLQGERHHLLQRIVAPVNEPVTLAEAKLYLRLDDSNEDTLVGDLIVAARMMAENWLRRSLITQSWKLAYDWVVGCVALPMGPVSAISSVTVYNRDGTSGVIDSSVYWLNAAHDTLDMAGVLGGARIEIVYIAGYGDAAAVPKPIKQGMLSHIAAMYDNRGDGNGAVLPAQTVALYAPWREVRL